MIISATSRVCLIYSTHVRWLRLRLRDVDVLGVCGVRLLRRQQRGALPALDPAGGLLPLQQDAQYREHHTKPSSPHTHMPLFGQGIPLHPGLYLKPPSHHTCPIVFDFNSMSCRRMHCHRSPTAGPRWRRRPGLCWVFVTRSCPTSTPCRSPLVPRSTFFTRRSQRALETSSHAEGYAFLPSMMYVCVCLGRLWRAHVDGSTVARPLFLNFPHDPAAYQVTAAKRFSSRAAICMRSCSLPFALTELPFVAC